MKKLIVLALLLLLLGLSQAHAAEFSASDCPFNNNGSYQIDCGFVSVPADHAAPDGAAIQLAVAIIRSNNPDKAPDPVLYLQGGPGAAPVADAPMTYLKYPFLGLALQNRDVILVDQRGMGLSQPNLYCTPFRSLDDAFSNIANVYMERMAACLDDFAAQGIDWTFFTTEQNALDLALVGQALGYEQVNLQGTSYGTLLGLIILREAPEIVRSAILDSVLIPAAETFADSAMDFDAAFTHMEAYCAADLACNLAYPNLRESFLSSYQRLAENPDSIEMDGRTIPVTANFFAGRVRYMLASPQTAGLVPAFIVGVANRDYDVVREFVEQVLSADISQLPNQALFMTMVCPQGASSLEAIETASSEYSEPFRFGGFSVNDFAACQAWGETLSFDKTMPISDVPVLLLSGEFDPLTPPRWSEQAAQGLSNSTRLVMPNTSHEVLRGECGQTIALAFLNNPSQAPDTSCTSNISSVSFILHTTVTRFPIQIAAVLLSIVALFGMGQMAFYGLRGLKRTAWWASFRRLGWMPLFALAALLLLVYFNVKILPHGIIRAGIVQAMLPFFMALQAAAVFNPSDEPSLEIQMAAPRSMAWLLAERVFAVVVVYSLIALAGIGLTLWIGLEKASASLFLGWLPSALFLSGLGIFVTVRSRMMALGVLLIGFLWFILALFAPMFLPGQSFPAPFHLIQPFLWPLHVHATLADLAPQDFWLNRLFLTMAGLAFMLLSAYNLRDSEELLLGVKSVKTRGKKSTSLDKRELKPSMSLQAVEVKIQPLQQILGIMRYEFLMRWRTRGFKVFVITPIVMMFIFTYLGNPFDTFAGTSAAQLYSSEFHVFLAGKLLGAIFSSILFVPVFYMFPVLVTDSFPSDKRIGVEELLDASPVSFLTQAIGRILGNVSVASVGLLIMVIVVAFLWYIRYGAFSPEPVFDLALGAALFCAITTAMSILLGASQPSSRRAIFLVLGFLFATEFFQMLELVRFFFPTRSVFIITYFQGMADTGGGIVKAHQFGLFKPELLEVAAANIGSLLLIGLAVWAWRKRS
jgi:pimeloyl-ACP methyl ester carboxylesterase